MMTTFYLNLILHVGKFLLVKIFVSQLILAHMQAEVENLSMEERGLDEQIRLLNESLIQSLNGKFVPLLSFQDFL